MDDSDDPPLPPRPKPSKIPSWIMLGFLLGALFVWALPRPRAPLSTQLPVTPVLSASSVAVVTHPRFSDLEASFTEWQQYALWAGDVSYVAMWDSESRSFRDCYQVVRRGEEFFFRGVPRPRNVRAREDVPDNSPLQFFNPVPEARGLFGLPAPGVEPSRPPN